jgi:hypothetical protein
MLQRIRHILTCISLPMNLQAKCDLHHAMEMDSFCCMHGGLCAAARLCLFFFSFFNACILQTYLSKPLTSLSCSLNAVFPGLKMWDTFAFDCFDFKVRPGTPGRTNNLAGSAQTVQPQVSTDYLLLIFFYHSTPCNCSACNLPLDARLPQDTRVPEKSHFSTLNLGLAGTGN